MVIRSSESSGCVSPFGRVSRSSRPSLYFLLNPRRTGREDFPHPALLKVFTYELKPDNRVVVVQAKLTINVLRGKLVPSVPTSATPSPDDMPDSEIDKMSQVMERR